MSLPTDFQHAEDYLRRLQQLYGEARAQQVIRALATDRWQAFWVNPLAADCPADFVPPGQPVIDMPGLRQIAVSEKLSHTQAASRGWVYIQNASSFFAATSLDVQPEQEVLDLAAAPGGKTIVLAAAMANSGRLAAVEPVKARFHRLRANLRRCGVSNAVLYQRDGRGVGRAVPERFDRVLVDAPCSSESHMRWHDARTYQHWSLRKVKECQRKQKSLLRSGYAALKPGGELIYCTCSFSPEENELVVEHLLQRSNAQIMPLLPPGTAPGTASGTGPGAVTEPAAELADLAGQAPGSTRFMPGLQQWGNKQLSASLAGTLRILPDEVWDGFYLARIRKP